jgi:hypothetical protein
MTIAFTRTELHGPSQRTTDSYNSLGGASDPLRVAHAPELVQAMRELAGAIRCCPDAPTDPVKRARYMLEALDEMREHFILASGSREALQYEATLRAGRAPEPEPIRSEDERIAAARAALSRTSE